MKKYLFLTIISFITFSCQHDFDMDSDRIKPESGNADFSIYIALGNSLTSGFMDNALYKSAQEAAYPAIIARQMKGAGNLGFKTPLMNDDLGGIPSNNIANKMILAVVNGNLTPIISPGNGTTTLDNIYSQGPFQNLAIAGAKTADLLLNGYPNPYYIRFASSSNASVVEDAINQNPTFFSLWIGNNDILSYASSGGTGTPITDVSSFKSNYERILTEMTSKGAKGVVANLPECSKIPFFTTIPYNALNPETLNATNPNQIDELNAAFSVINKIFVALGQANRSIVYSKTKANPILIKDKDLEDIGTKLTQILIQGGLDAPQAELYGNLYGQARQTTEKDLIVLTSSSVLGKPNETAITAGISKELAITGVTYPLGDQYVLSEKENNLVNQATTQYNNNIKNLAEKYDLAFVDMNAMMSELSSSSGLTYNGVNYTNKFITGGAFSLDGVHLNGRGYSIVANEFMKQINSKYNSKLYMVNPNNYSGIKFP